MADGGGGCGVKQFLSKPIQMADQVVKWSDESVSFRAECAELKTRAERLAALLRQAARADLYERPARRIIDDTAQVLDKCIDLVGKCRRHGLLRRVLTIIPAGSFKKMATSLDNSIGDLSWLLRVSSKASDDGDDDAHIGLPPIAQNEPIFFLIWEQIGVLITGGLDARADAAASLVTLARDNDRYGKLIIEEDGVAPLLRLLKDGRPEGQESAAMAIGLLARDAESVEQMVLAGVCAAFAKVLKQGPMKVQATVAWAVAELAARYPQCQDAFAQHNVIRLLVGHLAFETVQEHSKYDVSSSKMSIHAAVMETKHKAARDHVGNGDSRSKIPGSNAVMRPNGSQLFSVVESTIAEAHAARAKQQRAISSGSNKDLRESEDPDTKAHMKAMAAWALANLARGNPGICKSITESKALLCFAVLIEKGVGEVQYNSALALVEICRVAEQDAELRRSAFKPTSPAARAVVEQLLSIVDKAEYNDLLVPCIVSLGCLSRTFRATETGVIAPLVRLLDEREPEVMREAAIALAKFACRDNYLRVDHSKSIVDEGGARHLVQLVYFGDQSVQVPALALLCSVADNVPENEALAQAEILTVLEWASKQQSLMQDEEIGVLLPSAKSKLELYQSRGGKGYH